MSAADAHRRLLFGGEPDLEAACRKMLGEAGYVVEGAPWPPAASPPAEGKTGEVGGGHEESAPRPTAAVFLLTQGPFEDLRLDQLAGLLRGLTEPGAAVIVCAPGPRGPGHLADAERAALLSTFVRGRARELGPGRRVNLIVPGPIGSAGAPQPTSLLGRTGEARDVAAAVTFLLSDGSRFITGAVLPVDGGAALRWSVDGVGDPGSGDPG